MKKALWIEIKKNHSFFFALQIAYSMFQTFGSSVQQGIPKGIIPSRIPLGCTKNRVNEQGQMLSTKNALFIIQYSPRVHVLFGIDMHSKIMA